jgi:Non-histone chromosomal protein MC1
MTGDTIADARNFVLRNEDGTEHSVFIGKQPLQAALKAANKSEGTKKKPVTLRLRERGTKKVHVFEGWREQVKAPENKPSWMPDKIFKPFVKKEKIET